MAKNILIIYSSTDGHTINICEHIFKNLENTHCPRLVDLKNITQSNLEEAEKILIGASIRYGDHSKELYNFVKSHKNIIEAKENAFFSVNAVARKPEKNKPETNPYIKKFLDMELIQVILVMILLQVRYHSDLLYLGTIHQEFIMLMVLKYTMQIIILRLFMGKIHL